MLGLRYIKVRENDRGGVEGWPQGVRCRVKKLNESLSMLKVPGPIIASPVQDVHLILQPDLLFNMSI